jgi:eukaryotic-like serine/threonine-protein kinase
MVSQLGAGAQGAVYLGEREGELGFRRRLAIKVVQAERDVGGGQAVKSLANEARALAAVLHPHVVQVFDFAKFDDKYLLVMEFVEGVDLRKVIMSCFQHTGAGLPVPEALRVAEQVASGLAAVHGLRDHKGQPAPMVHRDLKPANIILSRHGVVKLVDFGLAKGSQVAFHTMVPNITRGTPSYMSPEQVTGEKLTHASDQFSLGQVLYEMFTGEALFWDKGEHNVMLRVLEGRPSGDPNRLRQICPEIMPIMIRCLSKKPKKRYKTTDELAVVLRDLRRKLAPNADLVPLVSDVEGYTPTQTSGPMPAATTPGPIASLSTPDPFPAEEPPAPDTPAPQPQAQSPYQAPPSPQAPPPQQAPPPHQAPPSQQAPPQQQAQPPQNPQLGNATQAFFFGSGEDQRRPSAPQQLSPAPAKPPAPESPPQQSKLGAETQAFFFGKDEQQPDQPKLQQLGPAPTPQQPRPQAPAPSGPGAPPQKRSIRDGMSKNVTFAGFKQPAADMPLPGDPDPPVRRPKESDFLDDTSMEDSLGELPPWEDD